MKLIKTYESFNNSDIDKLCSKFGIENYTINEDGSIDVSGDVNLCGQSLTKLPLKFRNVTGNFMCYDNNLTSLEGCPTDVGGEFSCSSNQLTSLKGGPHTIGGSFFCQDNLLTSLDGYPKSIGREFICYKNNILDLDGLENISFTDISLGSNPVSEIWKLFRDRKHLEFFNDCDIVRDDSIVLDRLNFFLEEIGKPTVTEVKGYKII